MTSLDELDDLREPVIREAVAWARDHAPGAEPGVLLHGDLLGQNLLLAPELPVAVIDWEYARRGDPAWDLAIVTRGVRRPFQIAGGLERLLESYERAGGARVRAQEVRVHEVCLAAAWYRSAVREGRAGAAQQELGRLRAIPRRSDP